MNGIIKGIFGAKTQVAIGVASLAVAFALWGLGTAIIPGAYSWPWHWSVGVFIFHASMFFGCVACYAIVATGLGFRATERVEQVVIEQADIEVNGG